MREGGAREPGGDQLRVIRNDLSAVGDGLVEGSSVLVVSEGGLESRREIGKEVTDLVTSGADLGDRGGGVRLDGVVLWRWRCQG